MEVAVFSCAMKRPGEIVRYATSDLAENELFFATLQEITTLINGGRAQETIFESVLDCALQMLHAQAVFLITVENRKVRKYARRMSHDGQFHNLERYDIESHSGISRWVMLEGQPLQVPDATLGVLVAVNRFDSTPFDVRHLRVLSLLANHTAIAIENGKLFRRAEQLAVTD